MHAFQAFREITFIISTVHVRGGDIEHVYHRYLENRHALLPLAYNASAITEDCMLCNGRRVWSLDGRGDGLGRDKVWQSHTLGAVWQDMS